MSKTFRHLFGDTSQVRILDFVADNLEFDYTISQLSEHANLSRPTMYGLVERLTKDGLLVHTRTIGRSRFYRINRENPVVISLLRSDFVKARAAAEASYARWRQSGTQARSKQRVPRS